MRAHEQAHLAAAGSLAQGGATYTYTTGPDGKRYATGGEVQVDTSEVRGDPQATIDKAQKIRAAALAPADPSSADRAVAAKAARMEAKARMEMARAQRERGSAEEPFGAADGPGPGRDRPRAVAGWVVSLGELSVGHLRSTGAGGRWGLRTAGRSGPAEQRDVSVPDVHLVGASAPGPSAVAQRLNRPALRGRTTPPNSRTPSV